MKIELSVESARSALNALESYAVAQAAQAQLAADEGNQYGERFFDGLCLRAEAAAAELVVAMEEAEKK